MAALVPAAAERGVVFVKGTDFLLEGGDSSLRIAYSAVPPDQIEEGIARVADLGLHVHLHLGQRGERGRRAAPGDHPVGVVVLGLGRVVTPLEALDRMVLQREVHADGRVRHHRAEHLEPAQPVRLVFGVVRPVHAEAEAAGRGGQIPPEKHSVRTGGGPDRQAAVALESAHRASPRGEPSRPRRTPSTKSA